MASLTHIEGFFRIFHSIICSHKLSILALRISAIALLATRVGKDMLKQLAIVAICELYLFADSPFNYSCGCNAHALHPHMLENPVAESTYFFLLSIFCTRKSSLCCCAIV